MARGNDRAVTSGGDEIEADGDDTEAAGADENGSMDGRDAGSAAS